MSSISSSFVPQPSAFHFALLPKEKAMQLTCFLDLDGQQAEQSLQKERVRRSFGLLEQLNGISIIDRVKKNHSSLLQRLQHCPLLPDAEKTAIEQERGGNPYLTDEEFELVETLLNAPWKLRHATHYFDEIQQEQKILSLHQRRLEHRDTRSNAHTQEDGTVDNIFFSCGIGKGNTVGFLENASTVIEVDWKEAQQAHPKKFRGIWGGDHFYRYLKEHQSFPKLLGGTLFSLRYKSEVTDEQSQQRTSIKQYWFIREDGTKILFPVHKGDEMSCGGAIAPAMALRFIELVRLVGPRFRRHVLDKRTDIAALSDLFEIFFGPGEFEVHIPGKFSLKSREGIQVYANGGSAKQEDKLSSDLDQELFHAVQRGDLPSIKQLIDRGANPDTEMEHRSLVIHAIEKGSSEVLKLLLDRGGDAEKESYYKFSQDTYSTDHPPLEAAISCHNVEAIKLLTEYGTQGSKNPLIRYPAEVTLPDLMTAVACGSDQQMVELLLSKLIDCPDAENYALTHCCMEKNERLLHYFIGRGVDLNWRHTDTNIHFPIGSTPLIEAIKSGFLSGAKKLVENGADVNLPLITDSSSPAKYEGYSPLMIAIASWKKGQDFQLIDWMMELNIDKYHRDIYGKTALDILMESKIPEPKESELFKQLHLESADRPVDTSSILPIECKQRLYYANAIILAKDSDGDLSVLLCESKADDWVPRLSFPKGLQRFTRDKTLSDTAIRTTRDLTGINLSAVCSEGGKVIFSEKKIKDDDKQFRQHFYLFQLDSLQQPIDLRNSRATPPAVWVKMKEILADSASEGGFTRLYHQGKPLSHVAVELLRTVLRGEKAEDSGRVKNAIDFERMGFKLLTKAIKSNDEAWIRNLIASGVDPNAQGDKRSDGTALLRAFKRNNVAIAKLLISLGASVTAQTDDIRLFGRPISLLTIAINNNSLPLIQLLEEAKAGEFNDPAAMHNAATLAAGAASPKIFEYFLKRHSGGKKLAELLTSAAKYGRQRNVELLLRHSEYTMSDLKKAITEAKRLGYRFDKDYRGNSTDYIETLEMLLKRGSYDDETLGSLLSTAQFYKMEGTYVQELLDQGAAKYVNDKSHLSELRFHPRDNKAAILSRKRKAKEKKSYYKIDANPASSVKAPKPIVLKIAFLPETVQLTKEHLPAIFEAANRYSCNVPYPLHRNSLTICGAVIHRPNHNGTHAARQARYLQQLFAMIDATAALPVKQLFSQFTEEDRNNLLLAAYFLRSGRVDENSHLVLNPDDYYTRSATIYGEYAKQVKIPQQKIEAMKLLIINSCKPRGVRDEIIDRDSSLKLGYELLTLAHELDLVRIYGEKQFNSSNFPAIKSRLLYLTQNQEEADRLCGELLELTKKACQATGTFTVYHKTPGDRSLFASCSSSGAVCWHALQHLPIDDVEMLTKS